MTRRELFQRLCVAVTAGLVVPAAVRPRNAVAARLARIATLMRASTPFTAQMFSSPQSLHVTMTRDQGGTLKFTGVSCRIAKLLTVAKLDTVFAIFETDTAALQTFSGA